MINIVLLGFHIIYYYGKIKYQNLISKYIYKIIKLIKNNS